jgi:serine/threonine-protein kinase RsbW
MASREKGTIRLEIPSRLQMLDGAGEVVDRMARAAGFDGDARDDIQVAVHEALVNAMKHGNRHDETRCVALEVRIDADGLAIRVRDEGRGFDPSRVPDPLTLENLCRSSGRGILLMRALMDAVTFRRPRGGGTEVWMRKRLPRRVASQSASSPAGARQ